MSALTQNELERLQHRCADLLAELGRERDAHAATRNELATANAYADIMRLRLEKIAKGDGNAKS